MKYRVGRDFDVVTISIDPTEGAELATAKKKEYLDILNQPGAENGWHFLTGDEKNIRKVADQIGYKYAFNPQNRSYAHPGGMVVLTPKGVVSRYFFGVGFPARDVKLALTEAGHGHIGTVTDQFLLACYHYDPATGTYGPKVFLLMQILGFSTVALMGGFIFMALRRDVHDPKYIRTASGDAVPQKKG
jgi:protein SCO1/2